jgi:hypothetical protein
LLSAAWLTRAHAARPAYKRDIVLLPYVPIDLPFILSLVAGQQSKASIFLIIKLLEMNGKIGPTLTGCGELLPVALAAFEYGLTRDPTYPLGMSRIKGTQQGRDPNRR